MKYQMQEWNIVSFLNSIKAFTAIKEQNTILNYKKYTPCGAIQNALLNIIKQIWSFNKNT